MVLLQRTFRKLIHLIQLTADGGRMPGVPSITAVSSQERWKPAGRCELRDADTWTIPVSKGELESFRIDKVGVSWTIETPKIQEEPIPLTLPPSLATIIADLFDDIDASNVQFIIHNPRRSSKVKKIIYAHTKIISACSEYFKTSMLQVSDL